MGAKGSSILEFTNNLDNESISLHRVFSAVIRYDDAFKALIPELGKPGDNFTVEIINCPREYNQISAMLTDQAGTVMAYGKIGDPETGPKTFRMPDSLPFGSYHMIVFGEQINQGKVTDYISNLANGTISLNPEIIEEAKLKLEFLTVTIQDIEGLKITKTPESGELIQPQVNGNIVDIVFTAKEGYHFPEDYGSRFDKTDLAGLELIRISDTQIMITGKPETDVEIRLLPAISKLFIPFEKSPQNPPDDLFDANEGIGNTTAGMEYAFAPEATEWLKCDELVTKVAPGIWYVRYCETSNHYSSDAVEVTVAVIGEVVEPGIIKKSDGEYVLGSCMALRFVCEGLFDDCQGIFVDGKLMDEVGCTYEAGNTILTLTSDKLDTLEPGVHQITVSYGQDDNRVAEFMVIANEAGLFENTQVISAEQTDQEEIIEAELEPGGNDVAQTQSDQDANYEDQTIIGDVYECADYAESLDDNVAIAADMGNDSENSDTQIDSITTERAAATVVYLGMTLLSVVMVSLLKGKKKPSK